MFILSLILFFIILGLLVLIHEFGHFIAAKKSGVLVEEFGFGFPPRVWGKKIGETLYSLNAIPIGGFVRPYGEEYYQEDAHVDPKLKNRAFVNKKPWQKSIILVAGVFMNIVLGVAIYYVLLSINGFKSEPLPVLIQHNYAFGQQEKQVAVINVVKDSPAQKAGVKVEDIALRFQINEEVVDNSWKTINSAQEFISAIKQAENKHIFIELVNLKNGSKRVVRITPVMDQKLNRPIIGVSLFDMIVFDYSKSPVQKIFAGFNHAYNVIDYNVTTISYLVSSSFRSRNVGAVSNAVSGPAGIFNVIYDTVKTSGPKLVVNLLNITALLSLSLAIMNILPFPALDGGRLVFVIYEWISGKRPHPKVEQYANLVGIIILLSLALVITINDIRRFFF